MRVGRVCARAVVAATAGDAIAGRRREDCAFVESLSSVAHRPPPPVTENHPLYIDGTKIYGVGILEDPIRGSKRGKGMQHLTSSYWLYDMGTFNAAGEYAHPMRAQIFARTDAVALARWNSGAPIARVLHVSIRNDG